MKTGAEQYSIIFLLITLQTVFVLASDNAVVDEIDITASRIMHESGSITAPVSGSSLRNLPEVMVVSQGVPGSQSDIQIRGSSFNGAGLAINGLALQNPQTEHFNGDLPLPPVLFGAPVLLSGMSMARDTAGHLVGTVDLRICPVRKGGLIEAGAGEDGNRWQGAVVQEVLSDKLNGRSAVTLFGYKEVSDGIDYSDNYLDRWNGGAHFQVSGARSQTDIIAARQNREFGARSYYGAPSSRPSEESVDDTFLFAGSSFGYGDSTAGFSAAVRNVKDQYIFDRRDPAFYQNSHELDVRTATINGTSRIGELLSLVWRGTFEDENLDSTNLGGHDRSRGGLMLAAEREFGGFRVTCGGRNYFFSDESPEAVPLLGLSADVAEGRKVFINGTKTIRQPSYTELYYHSLSSQGDETLDRSSATSVEAGYVDEARDDFSWQISGFHRNEHNVVDWIWDDANSKWQAADIGTIDINGAELSGRWRVLDKVWLSGLYIFLDKSDNVDIYASRYALDYARHGFVAGGTWEIARWCELSFIQAVRKYEPNMKRTSGRTLSDGSVRVRMAMGCLPGAELILACENVWDDDFEYLPGQPRGGRRFMSTIRYSW